MSEPNPAPIVSVVIPCYNQGAYVDEAVDSVLAQTFAQFEIIIVNDGSTDPATNQLLAEYTRAKTRVLTTTNQGLAAARNNGIRAARGRYILPLDADDRIGPSYIERAVDHLETYPQTGIVYCRAQLFGAVEAEWDLPEFSLETMLIDNVIFCSALFRRSDWQQVGGYDTSFRFGWEDYDFWLALLAMGRQVYRLGDIHFFYRIAADSMVRARPREHKLATFRTLFHKYHHLYSQHIEVWIDALLDAREAYHVARLVDPAAESTGDARYSRKVNNGPCRLEFDLPAVAGEGLRFHPAAGPVILRVEHIAVSAPGDEPVGVSWSSNADIVDQGLLFFFSAEPAPALDLVLPAGHETSGPGDKLVVHLEFLAFANECLPHFARQYHRTIYALSEPQHQQAEEVGMAPRRASNPFSWRRYRIWWRARKRYSSDPEYRLLGHSGLFDSDFYLAQYGDIDPLVVDPLSHYLDCGWREGRNPHILFENEWYRQHYLSLEDGNPLLHYLGTGWQAGCRPCPLFWSEYYLRQYSDHLGEATPLAHYLANWHQGYKPNPLYDPAFIDRAATELATTGLDPLAWYGRNGTARELSPFPLFDVDWYLEDNPDLAKAWPVPLLHYLECGAEEGCRPNRLFDPWYYRSTYLDETVTLLEVFLHYAEQGAALDHRPNALFDPGYYRRTYMQGSAEGENPLLHYLHRGIRRGAYPFREVAALVSAPLISILVAVGDNEELLLRRCIHGVMYQPYPHWHVYLVVDGRTSTATREVLSILAQDDERIRIMESDFGPRAAAVHLSADQVAGDYLFVLDPADELTADALYRVAVAINEHHAPDVLYADENLEDTQRQYLETVYKPPLNRERLLHQNYISRFLVTSRELFIRCGGLAVGEKGAMDHDLVLKATEQAETVVHIARVLYRRRVHTATGGQDYGLEHQVDEAGRRAVADALARRGTPGKVTLAEQRFSYRVRRTIPAETTLSVLIDPGASGQDLSALCQQLQAEWSEVEIVVPASSDWEATGSTALRMLEWGQEEGLLGWRNQAAALARGSFVCFLAAEIRPVTLGWLRALLASAQQNEVGMLGGVVQSEGGLLPGPLPDIATASWRSYVSWVRDLSVQANGSHCPQNVLAVHEGICLLPRSRLIESGGYDADFATLAFAQLDLCFRLHHQGLANIFIPRVQAVPLQAPASLSAMEEAGRRDLALFQRRWYSRLRACDPFCNPRFLADQGIDPEDYCRWLAGKVPPI